ncbi:uncharacterized protein PITG_15328 [Phytophthora infestans T30-4]|uniref:Transmembrane protein, putative n=1 Tax=Phytophthora infestans (strain T30-4) TaxID=403677 RepID=D0NQG0_PHYIT|nr:uncharacterized protein PITG_15328 [Phytophthora infestans T30-4]EEY62892.1 transmembrane protein, putative [Phytophthora infestans T30-4]|eukprot:XP_002898767.1 transmembrane protein, putative [Phytophthora infestans T30-4]
MTSVQPSVQPPAGLLLLNARNSTPSTWFDLLLRAWKQLQVSYYGGKYSIERLFALEELSKKTPSSRAIAVCLATPFPTVAVVLIQESIPLQDPTKDWRENYGFWLRAAILSLVIGRVVVDQMNSFIGVLISWKRKHLLSVCAAVIFTFAAAFTSAHTVFPVPFFVLTLVPLFYAIFAVIFRLVAAENVVACTYPAYEALFRLAQGTQYQLPVTFLLPIMKMALRNMMLQCAVHMEDMTPEAVIFTVDFFNAVYVSSCMQSATSLVSVVAIIATDLSQTAFMFLPVSGAPIYEPPSTASVCKDTSQGHSCAWQCSLRLHYNRLH